MLGTRLRSRIAVATRRLLHSAKQDAGRLAGARDLRMHPAVAHGRQQPLDQPGAGRVDPANARKIDVQALDRLVFFDFANGRIDRRHPARRPIPLQHCVMDAVPLGELDARLEIRFGVRLACILATVDQHAGLLTRRAGRVDLRPARPMLAESNNHAPCPFGRCRTISDCRHFHHLARLQDRGRSHRLRRFAGRPHRPRRMRALPALWRNDGKRRRGDRKRARCASRTAATATPCSGCCRQARPATRSTARCGTSRQSCPAQSVASRICKAAPTAIVTAYTLSLGTPGGDGGTGARQCRPAGAQGQDRRRRRHRAHPGSGRARRLPRRIILDANEGWTDDNISGKPRRGSRARRGADRAAAAGRPRCDPALDRAPDADLRRRKRAHGRRPARACRALRRRQHQARQGRRADGSAAAARRGARRGLCHHGRLHGRHLARHGAGRAAGRGRRVHRSRRTAAARPRPLAGAGLPGVAGVTARRRRSGAEAAESWTRTSPASATPTIAKKPPAPKRS